MPISRKRNSPTLRIGQPVDLDVDMYGSHQTFKGASPASPWAPARRWRFCPPENATGNFVKVVQRLPVRIDLLDYDPDSMPLFVGLSGHALRPHQGIAHRPGRRQILLPADAAVAAAPTALRTAKP